MEQLQLNHLAAYLPYKLKMMFPKSGRIIELTGLQDKVDGLILYNTTDTNYHTGNWNFKPLLRPLSDLIKDIDINGELMAPCDYFEYGDENQDEIFRNASRDLETIGKNNLHHDIQFQPHGVIEKLFEWKFDVFGLIPQKLAIDVNSLSENVYK